MKKSLICVLIVLLAVMSGCNNNKKSEEEQQILENVWTYIQGTDMPKDEEWENAWLNGEIEEIQVSDEMASYTDVDEKYRGQTIFLVTPVFETELVAYPSILVDQETKKVIGELPGE